MTGEYAGFVFAAYTIAAVVLASVTLQSWLAWRRVRKEKPDA